MRFLGIVFLALLIASPAMANMKTAEYVGDVVSHDVQPAAPIWGGPAAVLWDNGGFVTHPAGGAGGADLSVLQTALGMTIYGFGHQFSVPNYIADDFTVPPGDTWTIDSITFFAYQSGSSTFSTITGVYFKILSGPPPGGGLVFGDLTTNRMTSTTWSNCYRALDTDPGASNRPIMANVAEPGAALVLNPGTYWIVWCTNGTLTSGPWAPPTVTLGATGSGNGMQSVDAGATYAPVLDVGIQDFPFIIQGSHGATAAAPTTWGNLKGLYR
jgi:hypothetical protein